MGLVASVNSKEMMLVKALLAARDILIEELHRLSKAVDQLIDLTDFTSKLDDARLFGKDSGKPQNGLEVRKGFLIL